MRRAKITLLVLSSLSFVAVYAGCGSSDSNNASNDAGSDGSTDASILDAGAPADSGNTARDATDATLPGPCDTDLDGGIHAQLSCTGLYTDIGQKTVSPSARAYTPGLVFWSDGAEKQRFLQIPAGAKIDTSNMDAWKFPVGTKAWKQFSLGGKRIETRLIEKAANGWLLATYAWNADESEATRIDTGIFPVPGTNDYEVPSKAACRGCHDGAADELLGVEAVSLALPTASGVTLTTLANEGSLTQNPSQTTATLPNDATGLAPPALGWLHVNCGTSCHNTNGAAPASFTGMYLRIHASDVLSATPSTVQMLDTYKTTVGVAESVHDAGVSDRIQSGNAAQSGTVILAGRRTTPASNDQMPPFVSHLVDDAGIQPVIDWINASP